MQSNSAMLNSQGHCDMLEQLAQQQLHEVQRTCCAEGNSMLAEKLLGKMQLSKTLKSAVCMLA